MIPSIQKTAWANIIYIDGLPLYDMMINLPRFETNYWQHKDYVLNFREENVSAWCRVPALYARLLQEWGYTGCQKNVGVLGNGYLCKHCGDYNPSGSLTCLKCGGEASERCKVLRDILQEGQEPDDVDAFVGEVGALKKREE